MSCKHIKPACAPVYCRGLTGATGPEGTSAGSLFTKTAPTTTQTGFLTSLIQPGNGTMGTLDTISPGDVYVYSTGGTLAGSGNMSFAFNISPTTPNLSSPIFQNVPVVINQSFTLELTFAFLINSVIDVMAKLTVGSRVEPGPPVPSTTYQNFMNASVNYTAPVSFDVLGQIDVATLICDYGILTKL